MYFITLHFILTQKKLTQQRNLKACDCFFVGRIIAGWYLFYETFPCVWN